MVAPEPALPGLPIARVRRRRFRGLRTHLPESAPDASRRGIGVHGVRRDDADAADFVRQSRVVRPLDVARGHLVHADRQGSADSVTERPLSWKAVFGVNVLLWIGVS